MTAARLILWAFVAVLIAACSTVKTVRSPAGSTPSSTQLIPERLIPERFADLAGWDREDHAAAFLAFRAGCPAARDPTMIAVCRNAMAIDLPGEAEARRFFEAKFQPHAVPGEGILTAYFAPEYPARSAPTAEFSASVRGRPTDLVFAGATGRDPMRRLADGTLVPYPDRAWIETHAVGETLAWMRPEELFFLQVQGSGVLTMADGFRVKALFAATNGQPFRGIANPMKTRGLLTDTSGEAIRTWLAAHRGAEAEEVMRLNPRYAFFRMAPDDGLPPVGAANLPLTGGRAIAVDTTWRGLGELYWIDGRAPILPGAYPTYQRLVTALDTGGAIKGEVRADLYLGQGAPAGAEAGRVRHILRMHKLVPRL